MRTLVIAAILGFSGSAIAGSIHKCKGAGGVFVYQQTPCETEAAHVDTREVKASDSGYVEVQETRVPAPIPRRDVYQDPYQASQPAARASAPEAYQCFDGRRQWIQRTPCPKQVRRYSTSTDNVFVPELGQSVNVRVRTPYKEAVEQRGLNSDDICDELEGGASTSQKRTSAGRSSYERNKLRDEHGC
jgi:hypothetical protein